jgi:hypothetical protein
MPVSQTLLPLLPQPAQPVPTNGLSANIPQSPVGPQIRNAKAAQLLVNNGPGVDGEALVEAVKEYLKTVDFSLHSGFR